MDIPGAGPQGIGYGRVLIERALAYQMDAATSYDLILEEIHYTIDVSIAVAVSEPIQRA